MASIIRKSWSRGEESAPEGYTGFYFGEVMYRVIVDAPERVEDENEALWCADFESRAARRREHYACRGGADPAPRPERASPHPPHRRSAAATSIATASRRCRNLSQHQQQYVHLRLSYYGAAHPATAATDIFFSPAHATRRALRCCGRSCDGLRIISASQRRHSGAEARVPAALAYSTPR